MSALSNNWKFSSRYCSVTQRVLACCPRLVHLWTLEGAQRSGLATALVVLSLWGGPVPLSQAQEPKAEAAVLKRAIDTVLVLGDSLSAEYGIQRGSGWVALLEKKVIAEKKSVRIVNASISGDTTSGGRSRLTALLTQHQPKVVVIELGGNDALRGLPLEMTEKNLLAMTQAAKKAGAKVVLLGMQVPPNYGNSYSSGFSKLFNKVAQAEKVALVPFFLKGIADAPDAENRFQADRIHPNQQQHAAMLANAWPEIKKLIP